MLCTLTFRGPPQGSQTGPAFAEASTACCTYGALWWTKSGLRNRSIRKYFSKATQQRNWKWAKKTVQKTCVSREQTSLIVLVLSSLYLWQGYQTQYNKGNNKMIFTFWVLTRKMTPYTTKWQPTNEILMLQIVCSTDQKITFCCSY